MSVLVVYVLGVGRRVVSAEVSAWKLIRGIILWSSC
jgi:hypothetical protein